MRSSNQVEEARQNFRKEVREQIPKLWQGFIKREMQEFGEYSFFYCKRRNFPQPQPWEGDEERIRHIIQQHKQVIEYSKKLETRRKGNYLSAGLRSLAEYQSPLFLSLARRLIFHCFHSDGVPAFQTDGSGNFLEVAFMAWSGAE